MMKKEIENPELKDLIGKKLLEMRRRSLRNAIAKAVLKKLQEKK